MINFRVGKICPKCSKGKLEKVKECKNTKHKNEYICRTCGFTNF